RKSSADQALHLWTRAGGPPVPRPLPPRLQPTGEEKGGDVSWASPPRLVGAPLVGALVEGTHKGCPYETRKLFAKKAENYGIAMQEYTPLSAQSSFLTCSGSPMMTRGIRIVTPSATGLRTAYAACRRLAGRRYQ